MSNLVRTSNKLKFTAILYLKIARLQSSHLGHDSILLPIGQFHLRIVHRIRAAISETPALHRDSPREENVGFARFVPSK
jgi:hypothetical protein